MGVGNKRRFCEVIGLGNYMYEKLKSHIGHNVVCVAYGDFDSPMDICIECEDCCEVLVSAEDFNEEEENV